MSATKLYDVSAILDDLEQSPRLPRRDIVQTIYRLQDTLGEEGVLNGTDSVWPWVVEWFQARPRLTLYCTRAGMAWLAFIAAAIVYRAFFA